MEDNDNKGIVSAAFELSPLSIFAGLVALALFYKLMFKDFETFSESVKYWLEAQWRHQNEGMFSESWWGATKVLMWLGFSFAVAYGVNAMMTGSH